MVVVHPLLLTGQASQDIVQFTDQQFSYTNLLQELLLALVGFSGDVFIAEDSIREDTASIPAPDKCNLVLSPDLEWIEPPDRVILNDLAQLGYHYSAIRSFIQHERATAVRVGSTLLSSSTSKAAALNTGGGSIRDYRSTDQGSIYRQALASGLSEVLDVYQAAIIAVQSQVQARVNPPVLASLNHQLHDYKVLLPQLHHLVYRVSGAATAAGHTADTALSSAADVMDLDVPAPAAAAGSSRGVALRGAAVLSVLEELSQCGVPVIQGTLHRLLWHCNQALHKQLASWILYGHLLDPHREFFISAVEPQHTQQQAAPAPVGGPGGGGGGVPAAGQQPRYSANTFQLEVGQLPPCISLDTAEALVFIGRGVLLLRNPEGEFRGQELLPHQALSAASQALRDLQAAPTFNRVGFARCVATLRAQVAAQLWQLLVQQAGLVHTLTAIKDYFLLAKGEFAHAFLTAARRMMALPPNMYTADADVCVPWQQAALHSSAQHDPLFTKFRLHWSGSNPEQKAGLPLHAQPFSNIHVPSFDPNWDGIWLEVHLDWPMAVLLAPDIMARYNALFQQQLRLRRVQMSLEAAWSTLCELVKADNLARRDAKRSAGQDRGQDPLLVTLLQLRHHLAHIITNLQFYLQVDVIESNFVQLVDRINSAQDFVSLQRSHQMYMSALMSQSFLTTNTVGRTISAVFRNIADLCHLVDQVHNSHALSPSSTLPGATSTLSASAQHHREQARALATQRAEQVRAGVQQCTADLYTVLHSAQLLDVNRAPHLRQLFTRLDYNGFLTAKVGPLASRPPPVITSVDPKLSVSGAGSSRPTTAGTTSSSSLPPAVAAAQQKLASAGSGGRVPQGGSGVLGQTAAGVGVSSAVGLARTSTSLGGSADVGTTGGRPSQPAGAASAVFGASGLLSRIVLPSAAPGDASRPAAANTGSRVSGSGVGAPQQQPGATRPGPGGRS